MMESAPILLTRVSVRCNGCNVSKFYQKLAGTHDKWNRYKSRLKNHQYLCLGKEDGLRNFFLDNRSRYPTVFDLPAYDSNITYPIFLIIVEKFILKLLNLRIFGVRIDKIKSFFL